MTLLPLVSDLFLLTATVALAIHLRLLVRRLGAERPAAPDLGPEIAALGRQVDDLMTTTNGTLDRAAAISATLEQNLARADDRIGRLGMLIASAEDARPEDPEFDDDPLGALAAALERDDGSDTPPFRATRREGLC